MAQTIQIKRSTTSAAPSSSLSAGELAYSSNSHKLFIGHPDGTTGNIVVGGQTYIDMLDHTAGTLTASSAIIIDANSKIDVINVDNITIDGNTISTTDTDGNLILSPNGTGKVSIGSAYTLPASDGSANQFLKTDGSGALSFAAVPSGSFTISDNQGTPNTDTFTTGDTLTFAGGTGITTTVSNDQVSIAYSGNTPAIYDNSGSPALETGITAAEVRTLIGAGTSSFDGVFASLTSKPTSVSGYGITDAYTTSAHLVPTANETYDLGSSSAKFRDLYLSGSSINLGDQEITADSGGVVVAGLKIGSGSDQVVLTASGGELQTGGNSYLKKGANIDLGSYNLTTTGKLYYSNVFSQTSDLPSASTYHGMFAHVHATGAGYFAHGGNWIRLANQSELPDDPAIVDSSGTPTLATGITAAEIRTLIDVDQSSTDNSTDVTLSGSYDYLTISGQVITLGQIDLSTDVTGSLPNGSIANSSVTIGSTSVSLGGTAATLDGLNTLHGIDASGSDTAGTDLTIKAGGGTGTGAGGSIIFQVADGGSSGSTVNTFTNAVTIADDGAVTIAGNLTVNGTTTTVNSNTVDIGDNILVLNSDETGSPTQNAGIEVERGTATNVALRWNETTDLWQLTADGSNYSDILTDGNFETQVPTIDGGTF